VSLEHPIVFALLGAAAVLALLVTRRTKTTAIAWPAIAEVRAAGGRRRDPARGLSRALRAGVLGLLAVALAGPVVERAPDKSLLQGIDLMLVLDTSLSMRARDAEVDGDWRTRLELAREVVRRFALERVAEGDRVGLVVFGEGAFTQCPLTRDGRLLAAALGRVEAGMAGEATALGDALALAVKRTLSDAGVIVLLTDGRSNAGSVPVDVAAGLAASAGVRVHTVGIGSEGEVPMAGAAGTAGRGLRFERHDLDARSLQRIAAASGGRYFQAQRGPDLDAVYAEIDALERVTREEPGSGELRPRPEPFLGFAGILLAGEIAATRVLRRRLP
jgi:Ca-activated chloride channel family protein